jgi:nucleoid DNA-binding protein
MKPVKYKEYLTTIAEKTELPVNEVDAVLRIFWSDVRTSLTSLKFHRVNVINLGTFEAKPKSIENRIKSKTSLLERVKGQTTRSELIRKETSFEIMQMENLLKIIHAERERRQEIRKNRTT